MGVIFYASNTPGKDIPPLFPYQDVVYHFSVYLVLSFFFSRALNKSKTSLSVTKIFIFAVVFTVIYGISDEFHQAFVPDRSVSVFDVFIDTLGGLTGSCIFLWLQ
jgi:VanZ family protein